MSAKPTVTQIMQVYEANQLDTLHSDMLKHYVGILAMRIGHRTASLMTNDRLSDTTRSMLIGEVRQYSLILDKVNAKLIALSTL
jgi:hypothetical protein